MPYPNTLNQQRFTNSNFLNQTYAYKGNYNYTPGSFPQNNYNPLINRTTTTTIPTTTNYFTNYSQALLNQTQQ